MKEFKGTPGPWVTVNNGKYWEIREVIGNGGQISDLCASQCWFDDGDMNGEVTTSNARLIAAAPELLEALQNIIDGYESAGGEGYFDMLCTGELIDAANKAINKALGE